MHVGPRLLKEREKREEILVGHRLTTIYRSIRQAFFHETLHAVILHMPSSRFVTCIRSNMEPMSYDRSTSRGSSYRLRIESSETLFCASGNIEPCHSLVVSPQPHHPSRAGVQATVAKALKKPSFSIHVTNLSPGGIAISLSSFSEKKT